MALGVVRAIRPVALIITTHGSSSIFRAPVKADCSPVFLAAAAAAATSASAEEMVVADFTASSADFEIPEVPEPCATTGVNVPSGSASNSTVRRGDPHLSTASSISLVTTWSSASAEARMRVSSSMRFFKSSRSASSSMRFILVSRRRRRSRMYWAWTSSRSNTAIKRVFAASASSEVRITWITSSMSSMARSSPSTRCRRSRAFFLRYSLRRRITTRR